MSNDDHTKEVDVFGVLLGGLAGFGIVNFVPKSPDIVEQFPELFIPFWTYFVPIGLIAAAIGAFIASLLSPAGRIRGTADIVGVMTGISACYTLLPEAPNILMVFLVTIPYGFIGFGVGSIMSDFKGGASASD